MTQAQIDQFCLTGHPSTRDGEKGKMVYELEEFSPVDLQMICRTCIERHIERDLFDDALERQEQGRETLSEIAKGGAI